jgi:hypothetical protein
MSNPNLSKLNHRLLRYFYFTGIIEGVLILWLLIRLPSGPSNLWFLGYSKFRIAMMVMVIGLILGFAFLTINSVKGRKLTQKISRGFEILITHVGYFAAVICSFFIIAVLYPYYKILSLRPEYYVREYIILERISPLIFYLTTRLIQFAIISTVAIIQRLRSGINWKITKKGVAIILISLTSILVIAHISLNLMPWITQHREIWRLVKFFDLTYEKNIPAIFSTFLLASSAILLGRITCIKLQSQDRYAIHWTSLSIIFIFLALDEFYAIHEGIDDYIKTAISSEIIFASNWIYSGLILVIIFLVFYWNFFTKLPQKTKPGILLSGIIYVGSALGFEIIGSAYVATYGLQEIPYLILTLTEEMLEMIGIIVLIYTLMDFLEDLNKGALELIRRSN